MNITGEHRVAAPPERVWRAMHDADILRVCVPGCEDVQSVAEDHFAGRLMTRIGTVSTAFTGHLMVSEQKFPIGWQISAHAESPSAGWADGTATIRLSPVSGGTVVAYRLRVDPGGRLASVGDRLLRGVVMRMAAEFFNRLTENVMPEPSWAEPQDRSPPIATTPRRLIQPLMPAAAPTNRPAAAIPAEPAALPRAQRIIITIGGLFCAFILLSMGLALLSRG